MELAQVKVQLAEVTAGAAGGVILGGSSSALSSPARASDRGRPAPREVMGVGAMLQVLDLSGMDSDEDGGGQHGEDDDASANSGHETSWIRHAAHGPLGALLSGELTTWPRVVVRARVLCFGSLERLIRFVDLCLRIPGHRRLTPARCGSPGSPRLERSSGGSGLCGDSEL
jgi:hypothetical protein